MLPPSPMRNLLVFNRGFFRTTETFIHRQVQGLKDPFNVALIASRDYENIDASEWKDTTKFKIPESRGLVDRILTLCARTIVKIDSSYSLRVHLFLKQVFTTYRTDVIHAHYGWNGLFMLAAAKRYKIPLVVSFHGNDASAALRRENYRHRLTDLFDYVQAIIISSPHMFDSLVLDRWRSKTHLIPYGIDTAEFAPDLRQESKDGPLKILHAGRVVGKKGVPDLIRVFIKLNKDYRNLELHILGDGNELALCKEIVAESGVKNVVFYGEQPLSMVKKLMNEIDVFVLNSRVHDNGDMEGLPNALLEAMSFQKAVVSTEHGGIPLAITPMEDGLLVPERDNAALQHALNMLISDEQLRRTLGQNARLKIINFFSIDTMNQKLKEVFANVHQI